MTPRLGLCLGIRKQPEEGKQERDGTEEWLWEQGWSKPWAP